MRNLAVIPARGGSKRLPRKNVLPFMGKPMFVWSAKAALECGLFRKVIVSTEDPEIAAVARQFGVETHNRPSSLATDKSTVAEVCLQLLDELESSGEFFDVLCCLYATAPLRDSRDIASVMDLLGDDEENLADFAIAMTEYSHSPYQMLIPAANGFWEPAWPLFSCKKSQEVPPAFAGNGSTYAARIPAFRKCKNFYGPRMRGYRMERLRSFDIDTSDDFEMATWAAHWLQQKEGEK
jgi:CMP-N-acetylneuraminic acid synthetase